jgi:hypothetical protein
VEGFGFVEHHQLRRLDLEAPHTPPLFLNFREVRRVLRRDDVPALEPTAPAIAVGTQVPIAVEPHRFSQWFEAIPCGGYLMGHLLPGAAVQPILEALGGRHLFILRDPRAVLVSLMDFIVDTRGWPHPHFLEPDLRPLSELERLTFLLEGGMSSATGKSTLPFPEVYRRMLAWESTPGCLAVRFESLVGPQGGGTSALQLESMKRIGLHLEADLSNLEQRAKGIFDPAARTFRVGTIDGWRTGLQPECLRRLKDACSGLCRDAGYRA